MAEIHGTCDAAYEPMREHMSASIDAGTDVGASVAVIHDGNMVVDLWGGHTDEAQSAPWEADTITNVWSTTKTMTFLAAHIAADQGAIDFDRKVADYWPEFAAEGKGDIEVRHLMAHTSGVSGWAEPVTAADICDWDKSTSLLAAQAPWWEPGTASGYHALNQGHLVGEVVRRATGQTLGNFFRTEVAEKVGADFHIGLSADHDHRVSEVIPPPPNEMTEGVEMDSVAMKTFINPITDATMSHSEVWRRAEVGAANGHGNARSVATAQAAVTHGGSWNGHQLLSEEAIDRIFDEQISGIDQVLGVDVTFGMGYGLRMADWTFLPDSRICFWGGWGGSLIINDVDNNLTISYMMNKMASAILGDERGANLVLAAYAGAGIELG